MTHASVPENVRNELGIKDALFITCCIEDIDDLLLI